MFGKMFGHKRSPADFGAEIQAHIQLEEERLREQGLSPKDAHNRAHRAFGNVTKTQERFYESHRWLWFDHFWNDTRFAVRMLRKSPGFTAVAILTLALGIGANTAIFSIIHAVLLNGLPYPNASRLVILNESLKTMPDINVSWPDFLDWRAQSRSFDQMAAYSPDTAILLGAGDPAVIQTQSVSPSYFSILGVKPYLGRLLDAADDQSKGVGAVVISYSLWRNRFKSDPTIIGKPINLDGYSTPVVGILPSNFHDFAGHSEVYGPIGWMSNVSGYADRANHPGIFVLARLRHGASLETAQTEMDTIMSRLAQQYPKSNRGERAVVAPLFTTYLGSAEKTLLPLLAAVAFVLLLACANVANLSLARTCSRSRELSVRAALGASRSRLIRQLFTEGLLLSFFGAGLGLLIAIEGERLFLQLEPAILRSAPAAVFDPIVLSFTGGAALLTTILFGFAPSWQATRPNLSHSLNEYNQNVSGTAQQRRLRSALLSFEIATALIVLVSSGLMIRSLAATLSVDPGFNPNHVLALDLQIQGTKRSNAYFLSFTSQILERVRHLPGVRSAGVAMNPPLAGLHWTSPYLPEGQPAPPQSEWPNTALNMVTPDYFRAIGTPLLAGRYFGDFDNASSVGVAIVNQTMARRISPNGSVIGKQLHVRYAADPLVQIVGVVPDLKQFGLTTKDMPEVFVPFAQMPVSFMTLMIRASGDPSAIEHAVTAAIHAIDPDQPISDVAPLSSYISSSVRQQRFLALLLGAFGTLALALAAVGVYGVVAYATSQRTHEIGIRMALGAKPGDIFRMAIGEGMLAAGLGILAGIGGALALTRFLHTLLFHVTPTDFATFTAVSILLVLVALAACYIPGRRAMRVDPMVALRHE